MEGILFLIFGGIAIISSIVMICHKNTVSSALFLVLTFFCLSVLFLLLNAPFIAALQIIIYAGAIMVMFIFVIMLIPLKKPEALLKKGFHRTISLVLAILLITELGIIGIMGFGDSSKLQGIAAGKPIHDISNLGETLFTSYLLPFELISVLLLVAIIGAIALTKRRL